ncbi:MAG: hypothetical protein GC179_09200 [Anaerolineaceae bacterium]|nr:hypothetical protein [Anaerolineaceae bacterium]
MTDPFVQILRDWQTFYFMMGGATATLIGLMFVAVSLGADLPAAADANGVSTFVTPMLIHFGSALAIAAVMLVPTFRQISLGIILVLLGIAFTAYSLWVRRMFINHPSSGDYTKSDWKWYVYFPIIGDAMVIITGIWLLIGTSDALDLLAVALIVLLIVSVRNTWDLMMWIAQFRQQGSKNVK